MDSTSKQPLLLPQRAELLFASSTVSDSTIQCPNSTINEPYFINRNSKSLAPEKNILMTRIRGYLNKVESKKGNSSGRARDTSSQEILKEDFDKIVSTFGIRGNIVASSIEECIEKNMNYKKTVRSISDECGYRHILLDTDEEQDDRVGDAPKMGSYTSSNMDIPSISIGISSGLTSGTSTHAPSDIRGFIQLSSDWEILQESVDKVIEYINKSERELLTTKNKMRKMEIAKTFLGFTVEYANNINGSQSLGTVKEEDDVVTDSRTIRQSLSTVSTDSRTLRQSLSTVTDVTTSTKQNIMVEELSESDDADQTFIAAVTSPHKSIICRKMLMKFPNTNTLTTLIKQINLISEIVNMSSSNDSELSSVSTSLRKAARDAVVKELEANENFMKWRILQKTALEFRTKLKYEVLKTLRYCLKSKVLKMTSEP